MARRVAVDVVRLAELPQPVGVRERLADRVAHQQRVDLVESVLQAPPTHRDVFPDVGAANAVTVNLNIPDPSCLNFYDPTLCAAVGYITQTKSGTSQSVG